MLIPYVQQNGSWTLSDRFLADVFMKMLDNSLVNVVFYDEGVKTIQDFVEHCKNPRNVLNIHYDEKLGCTGIVWLNDIGINSAFGHFCFFPEVWGGEAVKLGKENVQYWFDMKLNGKPILDVILGKMPMWNERAVRFTEKLGFLKLGELAQIKLTRNHEPGMVLVYKTRE